MKTKIVMLEKHHQALREALFDRPGVEGAAFLLCGESRSSTHTTLTANDVVPVAPADYIVREPRRLSLRSDAYVHVTKRAKREALSVIFAHSHPGGEAQFSEVDNEEEAKLLPFLQARVPRRSHGTLVLNEQAVAGRIYRPHQAEVDQITVVGNRLRLIHAAAQDKVNFELFDRQVRAFGTQLQHLLGALHIGVVGLGGTGSAVAEQLARLGVGTLLLFDGDLFEASNVNRVYGSSSRDVGLPKVTIAARNIRHIGTGTRVLEFPRHITDESTAKELRHCDLVFGCTDKETPRALLVQLTLRYLIPVIDTGVLIESVQGKIRGIHGRITTLLPGEACLFCRGRLSPEVIRAESFSAAERQRLAREGYAPELPEHAPSVVSFTTATSAMAISELLHRLTGFMGEDRQSSEVLIGFDNTRMRTNRLPSDFSCVCAEERLWGRADCVPYLNVVWQVSTR